MNAFAERLPTVADLLRKHNIELTESALVQALKNPNPELRALAAMELAEDKAVEAVPAVKQALVLENAPRARVNIALALGLLGDPGGHDELKKICGDRNFPTEFRLYAVRYMFDLGGTKDEDCLHATEEIVQIVDSENRALGDRISSLSLLPQFLDLGTEESQRRFQLVLERLHDPEPTVQIEASAALAKLGNPAAIPYLSATIAREQDENIRSALETNLKTLQQKGKQ